jgi:hypothetical protein
MLTKEEKDKSGLTALEIKFDKKFGLKGGYERMCKMQSLGYVTKNSLANRIEWFKAALRS